MTDDLAAWTPRALPETAQITGRYAQLDRFDADRDGASLIAAVAGEGDDDLWRYLTFGPPASVAALTEGLAAFALSYPARTYVIRAARERAEDPADWGAVLGMASFLRFRPAHGSAEVGAIVFSRALQRTRTATDAIHLMARHVFDDLGYRRFEWKCDAANGASRAAALRFGFSFEGVFRQDMVVKGRNRDTAWYSIVDADWPGVRRAYEAWLAADNFDERGRQRRTLSDCRSAARSTYR